MRTKPKRGRGRLIRKKMKSIDSDRGDAEFFKVFLPHLASHQLMIPPDFIKYFKRTIKERAVLKDTGGKTWHVDVDETPKGFFFKNGWQSFVDDHRLKVGDFLVFRYDDRCRSFLVKIYGANGCKKETSIAWGDIENCSLKSNEKTAYSRQYTLPRGPYFTSSTGQSIQHKLEIPNEVIDIYDLVLKTEMVLCNSDGKEWAVRIYAIKGIEMGYMYMGKGWSEFQRENCVGSKDNYSFTFGTTRSSTTILVQLICSTPLDM